MHRQTKKPGSSRPRKGQDQKPADHPKAVLPPDYQLNLSDFALFLSVMKVKEAYENVLSIILDEPDLPLRRSRLNRWS